MHKISNTLILPLAIGLVSSIIAAFFLKSIWPTSLIALAIILGIIIILVYLRLNEINKKFSDLIEAPIMQPPQCCGLHKADFSQVFEQTEQSRGLSMELVSNNFKFLGVSAEPAFRNPRFKNALIEKLQKENCHFQILLLDYKCEEIVEQHAKQESTNKDVISLNIQQSLAIFKDLSTYTDGKLEVWLYKDLPIFRLIIIDDERVFVSFYGAARQSGTESPQLVFLKNKYSFFNAYSKFYDSLLRKSDRYI